MSLSHPRILRWSACWSCVAAGMMSAAGNAADAPVPMPAQPTVSDMMNPAPNDAHGPHLSAQAKSAAEAGIEALGKNKFEDAETNFLKLLKLLPDNPSALVNLGLIEFRLGKMDDAQRYLEKAIEVKPDAALAWMLVGMIRTNRNDLEGATAALAQAVYLNPKSPQAHNYFAATLSKRGWYSGAEDELQQAIQLSPDFAEAHFNLALTYMLRTPPSVELARRHYQKALELGAPADPDLAAKLEAAPEQTITP